MMTMMDVFTRPIADHRAMCLPERPSLRNVVDGYPPESKLRQVAIAHELSSMRCGDGRRARHMGAAALDMPQAEYDVLLAEHMMLSQKTDMFEAHAMMREDIEIVLVAAAWISRVNGCPSSCEDVAAMTGIDAEDAERVLQSWRAGSLFRHLARP